MRDVLKDAAKHTDDGYGRAQKHMRRALPKRFYKEVGVSSVGDGFAVILDGRSPRTPGQIPVVVPIEALARAMAAEWAAQGELIDPDTMPVVRLVNSAVEAGEARVPELRAQIVRYAGNDLMLYRADAPRELVAEQERLWDTAMVRLARHFGVLFRPTIGIVHQPQAPATLDRLTRAVADETLIPLAAVVQITGLTGSGLLALALRHGLMTAEEVWLAAHVDEDFNMRQWGEVAEAGERRAVRRRDFDAAVTVLEMLPLRNG